MAQRVETDEANGADEESGKVQAETAHWKLNHVGESSRIRTSVVAVVREFMGSGRD